jgi:crotonobetainyl-CoA:carnitine CoA-transferase CaiB-like acyl-CoA transferase
MDRAQTGQGQLVDVAVHDALAVTVEMAFPYWTYQRSLVHRQTCRHAQPTPTQPALVQCGDGKYLYLTLILNDDKAWAGLVAWLKSHDLALNLDDDSYADHQFRQNQSAHIQGIFEAFVQLYPAADLFRQGQEYGLPIGVVSAPEDLFDDPHLRARNFFQSVLAEGYGELQYPGPPYRFNNLRWQIRGGPPMWEKGDNID